MVTVSERAQLVGPAQSIHYPQSVSGHYLSSSWKDIISVSKPLSTLLLSMVSLHFSNNFALFADNLFLV